MDTRSPSATGTEGLGVVAAIAALAAALMAFRYVPWIIGAVLLAVLIVVLIPRGNARRAAVYALAATVILAAPAALAAVNDYQHTTTRRATSSCGKSRPAGNPAGREPRACRPSTRETSRKAQARQRPAAARRVTVRTGFLAAWNPTRGVLGPFHLSALTRWWALTASVTLALTALLAAVLLGWLASRAGRPAAGPHASWPRLGDSSRTWRPS